MMVAYLSHDAADDTEHQRHLLTTWMASGWGLASQVASQLTSGGVTRGSKPNTEGEGFEPPKACTLVVFKTTAIDHSAIPPATINHTCGQAAANTPSRKACATSSPFTR